MLIRAIFLNNIKNLCKHIEKKKSYLLALHLINDIDFIQFCPKLLTRLILFFKENKSTWL